MSRHGYTDDGDDDPLALGRWRAQVKSAIRGKRGQAFLRELAAAMDAMPVKELIASELVNKDGDCCTIGVVCKARGIDVSKIDYECPESVGAAVGIAHQMAAEIEYYNDEYGERFERYDLPVNPDAKPSQWQPKYGWNRIEETPAERWQRMRDWVAKKIKAEPSTKGPSK